MMLEKKFGLEPALLCNESIMYYRLQDVRRNTVDYWIDIIKDHFAFCEERQIPVASLNHFLTEDVIPTPYSNARGKEVSALMPDLQGYTVFAMPQSPQAMLIQAYMQKDMMPTRQRALFFTIEEALDWLKLKLNIDCDERLG